MKKTTVSALLLIALLTINGCSNKQNVADNISNNETVASATQQETITEQTADSEITQEETTEEITKETPEGTTERTAEEITKETIEETQEQIVIDNEYAKASDDVILPEETSQTDNNSFAASYAAASQYSQLVIVQSSGTRATVTMHELQNGVWTEILRTEGFVGSKGVGQASEYTSATPQGTFPLYFAFGINPNPGTKVPYLQVDEYDYWVGDSSSPLYNQYARAKSDTDWDKSVSERIIDYPTAYGYCLFIGYNIEGVPGKGSCFFLHCSNGRPTAGCVSVPETDMAFILRNIGEDCGIVIE